MKGDGLVQAVPSAPERQLHESLSVNEAFDAGDYTGVALRGPPEDWRTLGALALAGLPQRATAALAKAPDPEARFYLGVAHWIAGEDARAKRVLRDVDSAHARRLLALISKPQIQVLAQSIWLPDYFDDPKFVVRRVGVPRTVRNLHGHEVPNPAPPSEPFRRLLPSLQDGPAADFYFTNMLEWEILPYDLQELPCPTFGVTSDFDIHLQNIYPWLPHFDELITVGTEEQRKVARLSGRPVSVFPKMFPLPAALPAVPGEPRCFDLYISGTIANPYHPDKAALMHQLLQRSTRRICYVDGFLHPEEYYRQMGRCKASFTYVRHGTSMPSRGLEALAMGCAVLTQKGSPLALFAGENEGVLTYDAGAGELPAALDEVARHWPQWEQRALRGAAIVRRDFTRSKCISQFLRFLTVLAARPRTERSRVETVRYQKRGVLQRGHCYTPPIAGMMLQENLRQPRPTLGPVLECQHTLNLAREVDLYASADLRSLSKGIGQAGLDAGRAAEFQQNLALGRKQAQQAVARLYTEGLQRHPDSLVMRFNAFRHAVHLGSPEEIPAALHFAQQAVNQPVAQWQVEAMDDVFPWDYHSNLFNYRAYLDTLTAGLAEGRLDTDRLKSLILASLHGYLGVYLGSVENLERAVALDPEFPFHRFRLAQALERRNQSGDQQRAADILAELTLASILVESAFRALLRLMEVHGVQVPAFDQIERTVRRLRNISESSQDCSSSEYGSVSLMLPPGLSQLPLEMAPAHEAPDPPAVRPSAQWQSDRLASHRAAGLTSRRRPKILLIPFECANWQNARAWSYTGYYAFEEGLRAAGADFFTLPAIGGLPSEHPASFLRYARDLCRGRQFDQAWIWITHNDYHPDLFSWLREIAPVRLGVVMESLEHTPDELAVYTKLPGRRERVMTLLRHMTDLLAFDENDAAAIPMELPLRAMWCPPIVPWRSVCEGVELPPPGPAVFHGTLYSPERQAFLKLPQLKTRLAKPRLPEEDTNLPAQFDATQLQMLNQLNGDGRASVPCLELHLDRLRRLRRQFFGLWLRGLESAYATVNLPSIYKGYAGRVVESMAVGRPVISWMPPRARSRALFTPDEEILWFDRKNPGELCRQIDRLRKDPAFARALAERAREKVLRYHTAEVRVRQILDWVENHTEPDYGETASATSQDSRGTAMVDSIELRSGSAPSIAEDGVGQTAGGQAPKSQPGNAEAWTRVALGAVQTGQVGQFNAALTRALALNPEDRNARKLLGDLCARQGLLKDAVAAYSRILQAHPDDAPVLHALAFTLEEAGQLDAAFSVYDHLMRVVPQDCVLAERVARLRQGQSLRTSPATAQPAQASDQNSPAQPAPKAASPSACEAPERSAVQAAPLKLPAAALMGHLGPASELFHAKKFAAAWQSAVGAIHARPFHPEGHLLLAQIAHAAGDYDFSRLCAEHARHIAPGWKPAGKFLKRLAKGGRRPDWLVLPESMHLKSRARLSVCMITRNEERFLGQCLASVRGLATQIVVVDTGSTDRTVEIAREHGAEIHAFEWCDDFSAARNAALEHATGDWVLVLDADEELLPEHRETILREMREPTVIAWRLPIIDKGREAEGRSFVPRLFRNAPALFFVGRVHEQVFSSLEVRRKEWGLENRLGSSAILHHGYVEEVVASRDKIARNMRLLQLAIREMPDEPNLLMSLGLETVRSGFIEEGLEHYRAAFRAMSALPGSQVVPELRETLLTQMATHLLAAKQFAEIVTICQSPAGKAAGPTASLHFLQGLAHMELKQPAEAAEQMRQCLAKRAQPALSPVNKSILKGGPSHCLALCLSALKRPAEAAEAFRAALAQEPAAPAIRLDFARFQAENGDPVESLKLIHALATERPDQLNLWHLGGQIALGRPQFLEFAYNWTVQALHYFPDDRAILLQHAEALLLGQNVERALPIWLKAHWPDSHRHLAAIVLCEVACGVANRRIPSADEPAVSREFINWYRQLVQFGAAALVRQLNNSLPVLGAVLPSAAATLAVVVEHVGVSTAR
jgi:tetratricopeptide (TPR) repeat protein